MGRSWPRLGASRGRFGTILGRCRAIFGTLGASMALQRRILKIIENHCFVSDFGLSGAGMEAFGESLGTTWRPLEQFLTVLEVS